MSAAVLDALEARAGASDADREAWLAERRQGITATEVRDLYLGKISQKTLIDRKLGRIPEVADLSFVPEIGWGHEREPHIAAEVEQRFGIRAEKRVFRAEDNPRYLASPDGIGVNFDEELTVSEIKTDGEELVPWSAGFVKKGYLVQVLWVMRVIGARRAMFATEQRLGSRAEGFRPGPRHFEWIEYDEKLVAELVALADRFLTALDAAAADDWEPGAEEYDEVIDTHALNYSIGLQAEKDGKALKEAAYRELVAAGKSQESPMFRVTFTPAKAGAVVVVEDTDFEAARAADEGGLLAALQAAQAAWDAHCDGFRSSRQTTGKGTAARVTVTAVKQKEQAA